MHGFDPARDTVIDDASIPYFYKKDGDDTMLCYEGEDWGEYTEFPFRMPEGHSPEDLDRIIRRSYAHNSDFRTNFDHVLLVFKNGDVYKADQYKSSVRGAELDKLECLCNVSDHVTELFFNADDVLCVLMDDNVICKVNY